MATIRSDSVSLTITINGEKAGGTLRELRQKARELKLELDHVEDEEQFLKIAGDLAQVNTALSKATALTKGSAAQVRSLSQQFNDLREKLSRLTPGTQEYIDTFAQLRSVNTQLKEHEKNLDRIDKELGDLPKKTNPVVDFFKKGIAAAVGFFAVERIAQWGKQLLAWVTKGSAALEAMRAKTTIVFGDAIDIVNDFAAINSAKLGVTIEQYKSLASAIGDILVPMGFQREEAAKLSSDLTNLSGALANWSNGKRTATEVSSILAKALTGERESLKDMGIVITELDVQTRLAEKGQKALTGSALQQAKAIASYELILERSKDAQTRFNNSQDSLLSTGNRLKRFFEQVKENFLSNFIPVLKTAGNALADIVSPVVRQSDKIKTQELHFISLIKTLRDLNLSEEARLGLIKRANTEFSEFTKGQITLNTTTSEFNELIKAGTTALRERYIVEALREKLQDAAREIATAYEEETAAALGLTEAREKLSQLKDPGFGEGRSVTREQQRYKDANLEVLRYVNALREAQEERKRAEENFERIDTLAKLRGISLPEDDIVVGGGDGDTNKKSAEQLRFEREDELLKRILQKRIAHNDRIVQSDEAAALQRQIFENEYTTQVANARIRIFSNAKKEEERLSQSEIAKLQQENSDREIELIKLNAQLTLDERLRIIEDEKQANLESIDELHLTQTQRIRQEAIIEADANLKIRKAKLEAANLTGAALLAEQRAIANDESALQQQIQDDNVESITESLELRKQLTINGLYELGLAEEDFQKYRALIALQYDEMILQNRLRVLDPNSPEALKLQEELLINQQSQAGISFGVDPGVANQGGTSSLDDIGPEREKLERIKDASLQIGSQIAQQQLDLTRNRIEQELDAELTAIDEVASARLAAAEGDSVLIKKINAEARRDKEAAEREAARKRKDIAIKEAGIQGALAIVEALGPDPFTTGLGIALAVATTAAQIAFIQGQTFDKGGMTGKGLYKDHTGKRVAGVVHAGEWVAPDHMLTDPHTGPIIHRLEQIRRVKGGFAEGGFTTVSTYPITYNAVNTTQQAATDPELKELLQELVSITRAWPRTIRAVMPYNEFEKVRDDIEYVRGLADV